MQCLIRNRSLFNFGRANTTKKNHDSNNSIINNWNCLLLQAQEQQGRRPSSSMTFHVLSGMSLVAFLTYIKGSNNSGSSSSSSGGSVSRYCGNDSDCFSLFSSSIMSLPTSSSSKKTMTPATSISSYWKVPVCKCDSDSSVDQRDDDDGRNRYTLNEFEDRRSLSESKRFLRNLCHPFVLDCKKRWQRKHNKQEFGSYTSSSSTVTTIPWPLNIPTSNEISALEFDLTFCQRHSSCTSSTNNKTSNSSTNSSSNNDSIPKTRLKRSKLKISNEDKKLQKLKFRIASYYLLIDKDIQQQKKGLKQIKELAENGYPDGMCLYGMILNEGKVAGLDANPDLAVAWWKRCIDSHQHVQSMYEFAVALFIGEGIVEDTRLAAEYFYRAAISSHAGAAYMLGIYLFNWSDNETKLDRGNALEWLISAAELGHRGAQEKMLSLLEKYQFCDNIGDDDLMRADKQQRKIKRRLTGTKNSGGSRNPVILSRRLTIVRESRNSKKMNSTISNTKSSGDGSGS